MALAPMPAMHPLHHAAPEPSGARVADTLSAIRAEIDRLDNQIHDLIMARADLVAQLSRSRAKRGVPYRPAREAQIVRRLLERHRGPLPPNKLINIWHQILLGMTLLQEPISIATWSTAQELQCLDLARAHFGSDVPVRVLPSVAQVLAAVASGDASLAVLPAPDDPAVVRCEGEPWWLRLLRRDAAGLSIIARLPVFPGRSGGAANATAMIVAPLLPEPSGNDHSLIGFQVPSRLDDAAVARRLVAAGFEPHHIMTFSNDPAATACLAEVSGFVPPDDQRLGALATTAVLGPSVLGSWPLPPLDPFCGSETAFAPRTQDKLE